MRLLHSLVLVPAILGGGLAGSQVPRFVQEYEQRLGGALQEARRQHADYRRVAEVNGLSFEDYIARLRRTPDDAVSQTAEVIEYAGQRLHWLEAQARALAAAGDLLKPLVLARSVDAALLAATWERFQLTFTLDPAYGGIGALIVGGLALGMRRLLLRKVAPVRIRRPRATGSD